MICFRLAYSQQGCFRRDTTTDSMTEPPLSKRWTNSDSRRATGGVNIIIKCTQSIIKCKIHLTRIVFTNIPLAR